MAHFHLSRPGEVLRLIVARRCHAGLALAVAAAASFLRYSSAGSPPQPQLSVSTSSMTTKVDPVGLPSTSRSSSLAPLISAAFCSVRGGRRARRRPLTRDLDGDDRHDTLLIVL